MKNFLIKVDGNNPLWQKFKDWVKKEHGLHTDKVVFQTGNLVGMYKGSNVFVDSLDMNVIDVPVLTLEEWDRLVNGFVLPEKWKVKNCKEAVDYVKNNIYEHILGNYREEENHYLCVDSNKKGFDSYHFLNKKKHYKQFNEYTEITLEQFKKYVLKEKVSAESIVDKMKSYQVFKNINGHFQKCFKKVYTIKDLSEGKVAVINDGTKEELEVVLKAAFPEDKTGVNGGDKYYFRFSNTISFWRGNNKTDLPTQSVKEFYKQLKIEKMDNRFPFRLNAVDAQRIIDSACISWKETLAEQWGKQILVDKLVTVSEQFYNSMRKACTEPQNKLFDEIFGSDEEQFKVGDWVTYIPNPEFVKKHPKGAWSTKITAPIDEIQNKDILYFSKKTLDKYAPDRNFKCNGSHFAPDFRKATPEEIAKAQCPYEDGELCFVADDIEFSNNKIWKLRYATGEVNQFGKPLFYRDQKKNPNSCYLDWDYHKSAKGVELPKD